MWKLGCSGHLVFMTSAAATAPAAAKPAWRARHFFCMPWSLSHFKRAGAVICAGEFQYCKGSTAALISSVLCAAGYRVGTYTSPHLHQLGERIQVQGQPLPLQSMHSLLLQHQAMLVQQQREEQGSLTHFEVLTALAFRHFADAGVQVAVVETGLGGATDATNVFSPDNLALAVITALGYEHVEALGGSLASIAAAKAGILKRGCPALLSHQEHGQAREVVVREAAQRGALLLEVDQVVQVQHQGYHQLHSPTSQALREEVLLTITQPLPSPVPPSGSTAHPSTLSQVQPGPAAIDSCAVPSTPSLPPPPPHQSSTCPPRPSHAATPLPSSSLSSGTQLQVSTRLVGPAQHHNLATALAACCILRAQGWNLPDPALKAGLEAAHLPGRFQVLRLPASPMASPMASHSASPAAQGGPPPSLPYSPSCPPQAHPQPPYMQPQHQTGCSPEPRSAQQSLGPGTSWLVMDGAHSPESAASLAAALRLVFPDQPLVLVVAMAADKELQGFMAGLRACQPAVVIFITVPIAGSQQRCAAPGSLVTAWQQAAMAPTRHPVSLSGNAPPRRARCRELIQASMQVAYERAKHELRGLPSSTGVIVVCGSLHAVAAAQRLDEVTELLARAGHHEQA
ncbi:hypothetical protein QJQ45_027650 [Haematococcus lacustris]|nr:hypothetical protein QJQ45_027650 [Haematococcus lacustris]